MIPDLGKYAATVLWAYGASLALLVGLVVTSVAQGRKARKAMEQIERKGQNNG